MRHAVDAPVGVAVLVADGDGEAAVVGAHQVDHLVAVVARQRQHRALARVRRPVLALLACNKRTRIEFHREAQHHNKPMPRPQRPTRSRATATWLFTKANKVDTVTR